jgi:hypothetical protein
MAGGEAKWIRMGNPPIAKGRLARSSDSQHTHRRQSSVCLDDAFLYTKVR